ncbi:hypothetical protein PCANC_19706 [Puccinia coronata f. sp. avenae]|uniref:Uncharacterized protein n=1 Tax=Puccinia coronata f. sp. avenae TaxID=200324 RepID=A0A2N5SAY4_9BASI|nr:hypothetical protein PCANC_19706 [Puccinia coronata f. sp. avenae]
MEVDSTEPHGKAHGDFMANESEPMRWQPALHTPPNDFPSDSNNFNVPQATSTSHSTRALTTEITQLSEYLRRATKLQTQNNQLLMIQAANSECFNQELLTRFDHFAPAISQIMEDPEANLGGSSFTPCQPINPTTPQQQTPRGERLAELVRVHIRMLFGIRTKELIPPPASQAERRKWIENSDLSTKSGSDSKFSSAESNEEIYDSPFPYPDGPGHSKSISAGKCRLQV